MIFYVHLGGKSIYSKQIFYTRKLTFLFFLILQSTVVFLFILFYLWFLYCLFLCCDLIFWWFLFCRVETSQAVLKTFQIDVNKIYEGVDYKPFLRYQILLKFLFTALFLSHIDNPRIMYFWVAACFWQSLEIDRYCYVLRYRKPPYFDSNMVYCVSFVFFKKINFTLF